MIRISPASPLRSRAVRRLAVRTPVLHLLAGIAWLVWGRGYDPLLSTAVMLVFLATFLASAAIPAWVLERRWIRASLGIGAGGFLAAWVLLLAIDALFHPPGMLGCRMHELSEGGLPDAVCGGPLPFFSSGRRAWLTLPELAAQAVSVAFLVAAAARGLRVAFRALFRRAGWRIPRPAPRWAAAAAVLAWIVPPALIGGAVAYDPVLEARWWQQADAQERQRPRGPTAHVFFRTEDDSLETGDTERLVAWA
jgi:hypothetical protein